MRLRLGLPCAEPVVESFVVVDVRVHFLRLPIYIAVPGHIVNLTHPGLLLLDNPLLKLKPLRSVPFLPTEHKLNQSSQLLRIILPEPVNIVLNGLPMHPRTLVAIALVLVLRQPRLQNNHAHSPNITFVRMDVRLPCLQLQRISQLWRKVDVGSGSLADKRVVVVLAPCGDGIEYFDDSFLGDEDGAGPQSLVLDGMLLEMAEAHDAAGQDGPQFLLLELPLLNIPLTDLIIQSPLRKLKQSIYFVKCRTVLILHFCYHLLQRNHIFTPRQLILPLLQQLHRTLIFLLIVIGKLSQQIVAPVLLVFEEEQPLTVQCFDYIVVLKQHGVLSSAAGRLFGSHSLISIYNNMQNVYH